MKKQREALMRILRDSMFIISGRGSGKTAAARQKAEDAELLADTLQGISIIIEKELDIHSLKRYFFQRETSFHIVRYIEKLLTKEEIEKVEVLFNGNFSSKD